MIITMKVNATQFIGKPFDGIIHQKAQRVEAPERGIIFNRPERYVVNTPVGQLEIGIGDWVIEMAFGVKYVIRDSDFQSFMPVGNARRQSFLNKLLGKEA